MVVAGVLDGGEGFEELAGDGLGGRCRGVEDDGEFFAAMPADDVDVADAAAEKRA